MGGSLKVIASTRPVREPFTPNGTCGTSDEHGRTLYLKCEHIGPRRYTLSIFGEKIEVHLGLIALRRCPRCFIAMTTRHAIRCASCGRAIWPEDGVALYTDMGNYPAWATRYNEDALVGCLRPDCCPSGGFFAGVWNGESIIGPYGDGQTIPVYAIQTGTPQYWSGE